MLPAGFFDRVAMFNLPFASLLFVQAMAWHPRDHAEPGLE
jgi:hypothetical protein